MRLPQFRRLFPSLRPRRGPRDGLAPVRRPPRRPSSTRFEPRPDAAARLALGASPRRIVRMVLGSGVTRVLAGLTLGTIGALGAVRLLRGLRYEVEPWDPAMFGAAGAKLALVSLVATWWPARRASRIDPTTVIRSDG